MFFDMWINVLNACSLYLKCTVPTICATYIVFRLISSKFPFNFSRSRYQAEILILLSKMIVTETEISVRLQFCLYRVYHYVLSIINGKFLNQSEGGLFLKKENAEKSYHLIQFSNILHFTFRETELYKYIIKVSYKFKIIEIFLLRKSRL